MGSTTAVLIAFGFVAIPGIALSVAMFGPGRLPLTTRAALVLPMGFAALAVLSEGLALAHALSIGPLMISYSLLVLALVVVAARWNGLTRQPAALRKDFWAEPVLAVLALAVLVGFLVAHLSVSPLRNLSALAATRYWTDGLEIAAAHRVPALSMQWGQMLPSATSKVALNAANGALSLVLGRGPLIPMAATGVVMTVALCMASLGLARELGLRLTAPLLPLLMFGNLRFGSIEATVDASYFRAENLGRAVAFAAAALAVRALRAHHDAPTFRRDRQRRGTRAPPGNSWVPEALAAGGMLGVSAAIHLVPTAVAMALLVAYGLARTAVDRRIVAAVRRIAVVTVAAGAVGAVLLAAPPGDSGFHGTSSPRAYVELAGRLGLPPTFDPTLFLARGSLQQAPRQTYGGFYRPPSDTVADFTADTFGASRDAPPPWWLTVVVAVGALAVVVTLGSADLAAVTGAGILLAGILLLVALAFSYRFDVFALAFFGSRRLFDYTGLAAWLVVLPVVESVLVRTGGTPRAPRVAVVSEQPASEALATPGAARANPAAEVPAAQETETRLRRGWVPSLTAAAIFLVLAALLVPGSVRSNKQADNQVSILSALEWIQRNVPCDGRILADRRTLASFEAMTGRVGVVEGMGPYFRPDVLERALSSILDAREFLSHPLAHPDYLTRNHVAAILIAKHWALSGVTRIKPVARDQLARAPFLQRVLKNENATVYRVLTFSGGPPVPAGTPFCFDRR